MSAVNHQKTREAPRFAPGRVDFQSDRAAAIRVPWRRVGVYVVLALAFFLLGAVPMWLRARQNEAQRELIQRELGLSRTENELSEAVIDARRGDYEPARQTASDFFAALRNEIDRGDIQLSVSQREDLTGLLSQRDDIITLLARSDPAAADRLSNLYVTYRKTMSGVQPQTAN